MPAPSHTSLSLLLLCVNYHSEKSAIDLVESAMRQDFEGELTVYVVNNSPGAASKSLRRLETHANVTVLEHGDNLGYFGGAAFGLERFLERHSLPDWVIVSNPDIMLDYPNFFSELHRLHARTRCAVVAPGIRSSLTGDDQNPFMVCRPSRSAMAFRERIARSFLVFNAYELLSHLKRGVRGMVRRSRASLGRQETAPRAIYAPHGSFFIFNRAYFENGGSLDYEPFLYYEENFVAETARKLRLPVLYDPRLSVVHHEHASTGFFKSRPLVKIIHEARAYFLKEYYG